MLPGLLSTKLYLPSGRPHLVGRSRLTTRLNEGLTRPLTLLSAPPGFGKTTLLSEWIAQSKPRAAWLALDAGDNDPVRFWSYFIAALHQVEAAIGSSSLALLQSPKVTTTATAMESMLTALANEMDAVVDDVVLVLDDYHIIEAPSLHQQLSLLLDHFTPKLHLIISSRSDPPLHLARLRARDQLVEVHEGDLRFTTAEAALFLNEAMGLSLTAAQIEALETRTEGWIAGLQLAALSLRGREDPSSFVQDFTGSHRFVLDYLTDEVLADQPENVQGFLLQTSILERLSAPLGNALTGRADSQSILEELERRNLFLIALDDERRWYRYHPLFADVLRYRLAQKSPVAFDELHLRASAWFENEGLSAEAVSHALMAHDWERTARLIERASEPLRQRGEVTTLTNWMQVLPDSVRRSHPALCLAYARVLVDVARFANAETFVAEAEQWIQSRAPGSEANTDSLCGRALALRAQFAMTRGEFTQAIELSHRAGQLLSQDDVAWRGFVALNLAGASRFTSHWVEANEAYRDAAALGESAGDYAGALYALGSRGEVLEAEGQLRQAVQQYEEALRLARAWGMPNAPATGYAWVGLGRVRCEWNELDAALHDVDTGLAHGRRAEMMDVMLRGHIVLSRIRQAQGDAAGALAALDDADAVAGKMGVAAVQDWINALRAQVRLARGDKEAALDWANHFTGQMQDVVYPGVPIALSKVWLSRREPDKSLALLDHALHSAQAVGRLGNAIHILAVKALAHQAQGDPEQALTTLGRALELAEPEGYVRAFVDEGAPMARLLRRVSARPPASDYARRLLNALGGPAQTETAPASPASGLIEPLSQREIEVLRLVADGATNQEIAGELVLTVNTVKKHISNIFAKLGARNRTQAIARARQLNLL